MSAALHATFVGWARDQGVVESSGSLPSRAVGTLLRSWPSGVGTVIGIAYDPVEDGIWVANESGSGLIYLVDVDWPHSLIRTIDVGAFGISTPGDTDGIAVDRAHDPPRLLATDYEGDLVHTDDLIYSIDIRTGELLDHWYVHGSQNPNPNAHIQLILGICVDGTGGVWVSDNEGLLHSINLQPGGSWTQNFQQGVPGGGAWSSLACDRWLDDFFVTNFTYGRHEYHDDLTRDALLSFSSVTASSTTITSDKSRILCTSGFDDDMINVHEGITGRSLTFRVESDRSGDFPTIQAAIDDSCVVDGDTVGLADGTFNGDGNRDIGLGGKAIVVRSLNRAPELCVIDPQGDPSDPHRGFLFNAGEDSSTVLAGLTITGGLAASGGGIYVGASCSPWFQNCRIVNNVAGGLQGTYRGGALYCAARSSPRLTDCVISDNRLNEGYGNATGGGIYCGFYSSPSLVDCALFDNQAEYGGAIYCEAQGSLTASGCQLTNNLAEETGGNSGSGGAVFCRGPSSASFDSCTYVGNRAENPESKGGAVFTDPLCSCTFTDCTFYDNEAPTAGAIYCNGSTPTVRNCTFAGNGDGAIKLISSPSTFVNCTFYGNSGGIESSASSPSIQHCVFAFSTSGYGISCADPFSYPMVGCCDIYGNAGGDWIGCIAAQQAVNGNFSVDPLFCDAAARDFRLDLHSPCLPGGHPYGWGCGLIGAYGVGCPVSDVPASEPVSSAGLSIAPNPFTGEAIVRYTLEAPSPVSLSVFDAAGRLLRKVLDGQQTSGVHAFVWDGRDSAGNRVPAGFYFWKLRVADRQRAAHLIRIP